VTFNNTPAPLTLRANTLVTTRDSLAAALAGEGVTTRGCRFAPDGLIVESGQPLASPLARAGVFVAQDEASQLVGVFAAPPPGGRVLDACAAPGGKSLQLASAIGGRGLLVAGDLRPRRIRLLGETLAASGLAVVPIVRHDLLGGLPFGPVFDCVMIDAPCSGLGTIRRDPDIRWVRREDELESFAGRQLRMLAVAARGVRPGGRLVYATCSSEPEENEAVVDAFVDRTPEFSLEDPGAVALSIAADARPCLDGRGCLRTTPHQHGLEAFFAARLRRRL
jgi:16S rRNA (cytosine967-C5)-methyltransferase